MSRGNRSLVGRSAALALLAACERAPSPDRAPSPAAALAPVAADEELLDARADGAALAGRAEPAPPHADPVRTLRVRWLEGGRARRWRFEAVPVADARFVPGAAGAVVLTARGDLLLLAAPDAVPVALDADVAAPLSVARDGRYVAYARGDAPLLEVARYDLAARRAEPVTRAMAPAWCPALSPDGREVAFVSSAGGSPALYRAAVGAAPRLLVAHGAPGEPTHLPQGPGAPLWVDDALVYEDDGATRVLDLGDGRARVLPGLRAPVAVAGGRALVARGAAGATVALSPGALRGTP